MQVSEFLLKLKELSRADLVSIKGIGEVLAQNYEDFLVSTRYQKLVGEFINLEKKELNIDVYTVLKTNKSDLPLSSETICITGTFDISRDKIKTRLEEKGAKVVDTVSSTTTILLAGEKAGSKLAKAQKLGIRIVQNLSNIIDTSI